SVERQPADQKPTLYLNRQTRHQRLEPLDHLSLFGQEEVLENAQRRIDDRLLFFQQAEELLDRFAVEIERGRFLPDQRKALGGSSVGVVIGEPPASSSALASQPTASGKSQTGTKKALPLT